MNGFASLVALSLAVATPALAGPVAKGTLDDARAMIPALGLIEVQGAPVPAAGAAVAVVARPQMTCRQIFDAFKTDAEKRGEQVSPEKICAWMSALRCAQDPLKPDPC